MPRQGFEVLAKLRQWTRSVDLLILRHDPPSAAGPVAYDFHDPRAVITHEARSGERYPIDASLTLEMEAAQGLMDQLWDCGLRPTEGSGSAGSLAATQRHLEDMRRLVFAAYPDDDSSRPGPVPPSRALP